MLQIKPCVDKQEILPYCRANRLSFSEAYYLYRAQDASTVLACGMFRMESERVEVVAYHAEGGAGDPFLFDAILRAGLNYADRHGIAAGHIPEPFRQEHAALFRYLNFPPETTFNITNFLQKYKNCRTM